MKLQNSFYAIAAVQGLSAFAVSAPESLHAHYIRDTPAAWTVGQAVETSSGTIIGHPATNRTDVSEYLGIPFAQPPVGNLRFAAPVPFQGNGSIIAAQYSPDCPRNVIPRSELTPVLPIITVPQGVKLLTEYGQSANNQSEDCLTLNIWTKPQTGSSRKAVLFWIYGGGFAKGSTNNPVYSGQFFADDEDVVIVSANYRTNIFGFPGLPGVTGVEQNAGLLDQRLAIEWVQQNIDGFGGDPQRITIFGQSAGGVSVDYYQYAWKDDPIVHAVIQESGNAQTLSDPAPPDNLQRWYNASSLLGCGGANVSLQVSVDCVRSQPYEQLLNVTFIADPLAALLAGFDPTTDDRLVFSNYGDLGRNGNFAELPLLVGNAFNEAGFFKILALAGGHNFTDIQWALFNIAIFQCGSRQAAQYRVQNDVDVWRYLYVGNFSNVELTIPPSGAYHTSEIPIVWGTAQLATGLADTPAETATSQYLKHLWALFAQDPSSLDQDLNLPQYNPQTRSLLLLALNNQTQPLITSPTAFDILCPALELLGSVTPGGLPALFLYGSNAYAAHEGPQAADTILNDPAYNTTVQQLRAYISELQSGNMF